MTVLARKRSLSRMEFFIRAQTIHVEAARLAHKEKVVPKSYRFTFGVPMCEAARSMIANIERSDAFYPNTSWAVIERKKYLALAMADASTLYDLIACLIEVRQGPTKPGAEESDVPRGGSGVNINELKRLNELLDEEIELLRAAKNGVKLLGCEDIEEKAAAAEAEAQRLRDLAIMQAEV